MASLNIAANIVECLRVIRNRYLEISNVLLEYGLHIILRHVDPLLDNDSEISH